MKTEIKTIAVVVDWTTFKVSGKMSSSGTLALYAKPIASHDGEQTLLGIDMNDSSSMIFIAITTIR